MDSLLDGRLSRYAEHSAAGGAFVARLVRLAGMAPGGCPVALSLLCRKLYASLHPLAVEECQGFLLLPWILLSGQVPVRTTLTWIDSAVPVGEKAAPRFLQNTRVQSVSVSLDMTAHVSACQPRSRAAWGPPKDAPGCLWDTWTE